MEVDNPLFVGTILHFNVSSRQCTVMFGLANMYMRRAPKPAGAGKSDVKPKPVAHTDLYMQSIGSQQPKTTQAGSSKVSVTHPQRVWAPRLAQVSKRLWATSPYPCE